jgi:drug/metabolite transporter (DMT)-like permease
VAIALAFAAAFLFALGLVLQEKGASKLPTEAVGVGFLVKLVGDRVWLLGLAAQGAGFVAQAIALGIGSLVVVQPILVFTIVFALPLGRVLEGRRITRNEWIGATLVTVGLVVLLVASKTDAGSDDATLVRWLAIGGAAVGGAVVLYLLALGRAPTIRAALLGTAGGILFGLSAALTKTVVSDFDRGFVAVVSDWHLYALVLVSVAAFWLEQAALQTGALAAAVSTTMAFDPLSSLLFGIVLFGENLHETAFGIALSATSLAVMLFGLVLVARAKEGARPPSLRPAPAAA